MAKLGEIVAPEYEMLEAEGGCHSCPLRPRKATHHVPTSERDTRLILVGEAPGSEEVRKGEGFVGDSGKRLRKHLHRHGITDYSLANTVLCRPQDNRDPTSKETRCCLNQFVAEAVEGYPVVALVGRIATRAFFPGKKMSNLRGNGCRHPDFPGQVFFPMYHPAWVGYGGDEEQRIFDDQVARLGRILEGGEPDITLHRPTDEGWMEGLKGALQAPRISFDIETNRRVRSWALESRMVSWALTPNGKDVWFCREDDLPWTAGLDAVAQAFTDPEKQIVGQHLGFDLEWLERETGVRVRARWHLDTQTLYRHLRGWRMPGLKRIVAAELDGYRYLVPEPGEKTDPDLLARYNAEDVVYPFRLIKQGIPKLTEGQQDLFLQVAGPTDLFAQRMTARGVLFDEDYSYDLEEELRVERDEVVEAWKEEDPDFSPGFAVHVEGDDVRVKSREVAEYLYEVKGLPVVKETSSGNPSTDKEALQRLSDDHGVQWVDHLRDLRWYNKMLSTYVEGMRERVEYDGRIHTSHLNNFTATGRLSSRDPNLQNIPREKRFRRPFIVPPGWLFVEADYSQIEFRVMGSQAEDPTIIDAYLRGEDVHIETARQIVGSQEVTKEQRTWAKAINFSLLYGGTKNTVQANARMDFGLDFSDRQSQEFVQGFFGTYSRLRDYHKDIVRRLRAGNGVIEQVVGHREEYENWNHPDDRVREHVEREAINAQGQGPAAYMTLMLGIEAERALIEEDNLELVRPIQTVHDSVAFEVKEDHLHRLFDALEEANARVRDWVSGWFHVPLALDVAVGNTSPSNWGEQRELEGQQIVAEVSP